MQYAHETMTEWIAVEVESFMADYWSRTDAQKDIPPLDLDKALYVHLQNNEQLALFTVRDGGRMVAFVMYILAMNPHYTDMYTATCDTIAVNPDLRGKGVGRTLYQFAESKLEQLGVRQVVHHYRTIYNTVPMFASLGFNVIEHVYAKEIG